MPIDTYINHDKSIDDNTRLQQTNQNNSNNSIEKEFFTCKDYSEVFFQLSSILAKVEIMLLLIFVYLISKENSKFILLSLTFILVILTVKEILALLKIYRGTPQTIKFNSHYIYQKDKKLSLKSIKFVKELFIPDSDKYGLYFRFRYHIFVKNKSGRIIGYILLIWFFIVLIVLYVKGQITLKEFFAVIFVLVWFTIIHATVVRIFFAYLFRFNLKDIFRDFKYVLLDDGRTIMFIFTDNECFQRLKNEW